MSGYVVTRPFEDSGVGSNLASLAGALWLAGRLNRTLLVDWRQHLELNDKRLNYFDEFLALPPMIGGVRVIPVPAGDSPVGPDSAVRWLSPGEGRALGAGMIDVPDEYLALKHYHGLDRLHPGPESERFRLLRLALEAVTPKDAVAKEVDSWAAANLRDFALVVGVNVRTGNGHGDFRPGGIYAGRFDSRLFDDERRFLEMLERACTRVARRFPRSLRESYGIFFATDSSEMKAVLSKLPRAVTRRTVFPPAGADHRYAFSDSSYDDRDSVVDTLTDMFLLARCDSLVYNGSLFNQYARVVNGWYGGSCVHFESLLLRNRVRTAVTTARNRLF